MMVSFPADFPPNSPRTGPASKEVTTIRLNPACISSPMLTILGDSRRRA